MGYQCLMGGGRRVHERSWWWHLRPWAVIDVRPSVPDPSNTNSARGWLNQKVLQVLHSLHAAHGTREYSRVKYLQAELWNIAQE